MSGYVAFFESSSASRSSSNLKSEDFACQASMSVQPLGSSPGCGHRRKSKSKPALPAGVPNLIRGIVVNGIDFLCRVLRLTRRISLRRRSRRRCCRKITLPFVHSIVRVHVCCTRRCLIRQYAMRPRETQCDHHERNYQGFSTCFNRSLSQEHLCTSSIFQTKHCLIKAAESIRLSFTYLQIDCSYIR